MKKEPILLQEIATIKADDGRIILEMKDGSIREVDGVATVRTAKDSSDFIQVAYEN